MADDIFETTTVIIPTPEPSASDQPGKPPPLTVLVPGGPNSIPSKEKPHMAASERAAESMEAVVVSQAQGHAFVMEAMRHASNSGALGMREGLTHRIIGESGGGQARAQLAGGKGGVPTVV